VVVIIIDPMKLEKTIELFPIPLLVYDLGRSLTEGEIEYINSHGTVDKRVINVGNTTSKNNYILDHAGLKQLHTDLTSILVDAFDHMFAPSTSCEPYITQSWVNFTGKGQHHHKHIHPNSILSAVLYLKTAEGDKIVFSKPTDSGVIMIEPKVINNLTAGSWHQEVKDNMVVVFPSKLPHLVPMVEHEGVRVSLSINTFVRGEIGAPHDLNHLVL
jgi:uncharacterized protein (TIGR02466 family)